MSLRTLSDHIADICQNSIKAGASFVSLDIAETQEMFVFEVLDNAGGLNKETLEKFFDPFYTSRDKKIRRVGLGIPFLKNAAEQTGGKVEIKNEEGKGLCVCATFNKSNIDCQPVGDIAETIFTLITADKSIHWKISRAYNQESYDIDTKKVFDDSNDSRLYENPSYLKILRDSLYEMEESLKD